MSNDEKLQRCIPPLIVTGLIVLACVFYGMYLVHKERERFLSPVQESAASVHILKDHHQGFLFAGYGDNGYLFEMEPGVLKKWQKVMHVTVRVPEHNEERVLGDIRRQFPLSSQDFDFDAPTVELYKPEQYRGVIYIAYDTKTHRGVMRQYLSLMGGS